MKTTEMDSAKPYDLEQRTYEFALLCRRFLKDQNWNPVSWSDVRQLLRSSGSVAANFVEANEAISNDDFLYRIRLCKKEAKESGLWLRLLDDCNTLASEPKTLLASLAKETTELVRIFATIIRNRS